MANTHAVLQIKCNLCDTHDAWLSSTTLFIYSIIVFTRSASACNYMPLYWGCSSQVKKLCRRPYCEGSSVRSSTCCLCICKTDDLPLQVWKGHVTLWLSSFAGIPAVLLSTIPGRCDISQLHSHSHTAMNVCTTGMWGFWKNITYLKHLLILTFTKTNK